MAPSPSADTVPAPGAAGDHDDRREAVLAADDAERLLDIADAAIVDGLRGGPPAAPALELLPPALRRCVGVFVTVKVDGELNGCIGSVEGAEPLGHAAARHAWSAAFADPRLPALRRSEHERLSIEVSVLSPLAPVEARTRQEVLTQLRPGVDGLVLALGHRQGLFLPAVWDQLVDPEDFLDHLQLKAGLPPRWWHETIRAWRFTAAKYVRRSGEQPSPSRAA